MIKQYLIEFAELFKVLADASPDEVPNVVIGGKHALVLHGLLMTKSPSDLDLIIYQPTDKQLKIFDELRELDKISDRPNRHLAREEDYDGNFKGRDKVKVIKLESDGLSLDLILEPEEHPDGIDTLLQWPFKPFHWPIQSIQRVIEAKASYSFTRGFELEGEEMVSKKYMRAKDLIDFIDLKNTNFNIPNHE